jgi:hypothetical protein
MKDAFISNARMVVRDVALYAIQASFTTIDVEVGS